ncbi:hypothetical protein H2200_008670 [Cladophialophora chaetospira]|uniref:HAUS augmin-like complex subunit 6 N-terminal domain-containing protein n=1 Tax=Cladophialophora chaetospira TaxID=386627 RepID=A0AA38X4G2_9EURO|nr:hypothetical protein H2200_008670 [Cladophialophora chaetospira]
MDPPPARLVPSRPQLQWQARSNLSVFTHTLHLLDLDLLPDWPHISESTFSNSKSSLNLQARVKSTEWALYHLFRLYSPSETLSKLSSHFPPATSIQSKNLRAGLYKWLSELKSSGILPREVVLRKTMLDECKGEKYEEVLAKFAMAVLREKFAIQGKNVHAVRKSGYKAAEGPDADNIVPLILAHRAALQQSLRTRQNLQSKATEFSEHLAQMRRDIDMSLQELQMPPHNTPGVKGDLPPNELHALREQVNLAFAGDRRWARFILEGTASSTSGPLLQKLPEWPFEHGGTAVSDHIGAEDVAEDVDEPMRQLQSLISRQQEHIDRLTRLRDSLLGGTEVRTETKLPAISSAESMTTTSAAEKVVSEIPQLRFDRHLELKLKV